MTDDELESIYNEGECLADATSKKKGFKVGYRGIQKTGKTLNGCSAAGLVPENPSLSAELYVLLSEGIIPRGDPVFIIDTEGKAYKMRHKFKNTGKNIFVFPIFFDDTSHLMQIEPTRSLIKMAKIITMVTRKFPDRGTIVIDSSTDVTNWVVKHVKYKLVEKGLEPVELGEHMRLQPGDYQIRDDLWEYILDVLKNCNNHVIFTAREKEDWSSELDEETGKTKMKKSGTYSARWYREIPFAVDVEVSLRYKFDDNFDPVGRIGKIVSNQFDDDSLKNLEIVNPTYPILVEKIIPISHKIEIEAFQDKIEARRVELEEIKRGKEENAKQ